jgi:hypothetical protein
VAAKAFPASDAGRSQAVGEQNVISSAPGVLPLPARTLLAIFDSVYLIAMAGWVGSILFFSFAVAPVIFRVLGAEAGGRFVRALFPKYYAWGVVCGAIALPAFVAAPLAFPEYKGYGVGVQAMLILAGILIFLYCGNSLTPAINAARDEGPAGAERFDRLHKRSVRLNAVTLLLGLVLIVSHATRRPTTTEGIREMTIPERIEYERRFEKKVDEIISRGGSAAEVKAELIELVAPRIVPDKKP